MDSADQREHGSIGDDETRGGEAVLRCAALRSCLLLALRIVAAASAARYSAVQQSGEGQRTSAHTTHTRRGTRRRRRALTSRGERAGMRTALRRSCRNGTALLFRGESEALFVRFLNLSNAFDHEAGVRSYLS